MGQCSKDRSTPYQMKALTTDSSLNSGRQLTYDEGDGSSSIYQSQLLTS